MRHAFRHPARVLAVLVALALPVSLAACGDDSGSSGSSSSKAPTVADAWARSSAAMANAGAVYLTMTGGSADDALVKAEVPATVAAKSELHETSMDSGSSTTMAMGGSSTTMGGGMISMKPVDSIAVKKGATVKLEPGGYHIMLLDLKSPLKAGDKISLTLTFRSGATVKTDAEVRAV